MLAELVQAGQLPPVDERLPEVPFLVEKGVLISEKDLPDWEPGKYGGTLRFAHAVVTWNPDIFIISTTTPSSSRSANPMAACCAS